MKIAVHLDLDIPIEAEAFQLVKAKLHSTKVDVVAPQSVDPAELPADGPQVLPEVTPFDNPDPDGVSLPQLKGVIANAYAADADKSDQIVSKLQEKGYGAISSLDAEQRKFAYNLFQTVIETALPS